jgi:hypothetical protein
VTWHKPDVLRDYELKSSFDGEATWQLRPDGPGLSESNAEVAGYRLRLAVAGTECHKREAERRAKELCRLRP